jgi:lipopolysaccharide heptosyltransferase II
MTEHSWASARRVLCVRLDNMGDVLMCTPSMRALGQALPGRQLTLLASPGGAAAAAFIPGLDDVIVHAAPWIKASAPCIADAELALVQALRGRAFDAAVIFNSYSQSALPAALLCYLAQIPLRLAHCRENPYQLLSHWLPDPEPQQYVRHEVRRQLDLVASIGCQAANAQLSFALREDDLAWMRRRLLAASFGGVRPWVLLHPGASAASRRYPARHWAAVIKALHAELGVDMVLTGEAAEADLIETIVHTAGVPPSALMSLAGALDLGRLGAAIALAPVVVANNTGPAHIAAALGTPLVALYALTNPQHTPWQVESRVLFHDVPCRFCYKSVCPQGHHDCLEKVAPAQVVAAVRSLLQASSPRAEVSARQE